MTAPTPNPILGASIARFATVGTNTARWVAQYGRWPRHDGRGVREKEQAFGAWLNRQRARIAGGKVAQLYPLSDVERLVLDAILPGWEESGQTRTRPRSAPKPESCKVCGKPTQARGLCATHYEAWRRGGGATPKRRWTPEEDELVLSDLPRSEIAERIGRTISAVASRRGALRKALGK